MTTYSVHKATGNDQVVIALDGYGPSDDQGFINVGTFDHGTDPENAQTSPEALTSTNGDHIFIVRAKELLRDHEDMKNVNVERLTYLNRATNAPVHDEEATHTDDLPQSEPGTHPDASSQAGGEVSTIGTDPATTEANGVQEKQENEQTDGQDTGEQGTGESTSETETGSEGSETTEKPETVDQLKERIAKITDKDELQKVYDEESARDEPRSTAIKAIEARAAELG